MAKSGLLGNKGNGLQQVITIVVAVIILGILLWFAGKTLGILP